MVVLVNKTKMNPARWPRDLARRLVLGMIRFYQRWISPFTPPSCFFYPTCSHYTYQAIERFGLVRGGWLGFHRLCRCHPLARGGYDPVPQQWVFWPRRIQENHCKNQQSPPINLNDVAASDGFRDLDE